MEFICRIIMRLLIVLLLLLPLASAQSDEFEGELGCPEVPDESCCREKWDRRCVPKNCVFQVMRNCPDRKALLFGRGASAGVHSVRRSPSKDEPKCGTRESGYQPCTSKSVANKLFMSCCQLYAPPECHHMCHYETDHTEAKNLLIDTLKGDKCSLKHFSTILYCASQNRDNRRCCIDLDLNVPQLRVGSRCLRLCDPSGTAVDRITRADATCLFNWNVIMFCHHSGIREL
uniref:DB domain-containing protein n=1 Tax=Steinernema glaseri TaxID=37863 RepID=A0A1I7Z9F6_9BILA